MRKFALGSQSGIKVLPQRKGYWNQVSSVTAFTGNARFGERGTAGIRCLLHSRDSNIKKPLKMMTSSLTGGESKAVPWILPNGGGDAGAAAPTRNKMRILLLEKGKNPVTLFKIFNSIRKGGREIHEVFFAAQGKGTFQGRVTGTV